MKDRHLNLFFSYNRDNELIENNLTRALIVVLSVITDDIRDQFLNLLLRKPLSRLGNDLDPTFLDADFALQAYMDKKVIKNCKQRFVVIIATDRFLDIDEISDQEELVDFAAGVYEDSIPDGWIYNADTGYCFLLEVKAGTYPVNPDQIYSHAIGWLEIPQGDVPKQVISLTWYDVLDAIEHVDDGLANPQEVIILNNLTEFIGFFGYRLFQGFNFSRLLIAPNFYLLPEFENVIFNLAELFDPPEFHLNLSIQKG